MSDPGIPQSLVVDLGQNFQRQDGHTFNRNYEYFGFRCPHVYSSNPAKLQLNVSTDGINFQSWGIISSIAFKQGSQFFKLEPLNSANAKYLQIVVKDTFGANRTYLSQIFLYADKPPAKLVLSEAAQVARRQSREGNVMSICSPSVISLKAEIANPRSASSNKVTVPIPANTNFPTNYQTPEFSDVDEKENHSNNGTQDVKEVV